MLPQTHILLGFLFSVIVLAVFDVSLISAFLIFLSSFLIDLDHYAYGVYKKKTLNFRKICSFFIEHRVQWRKLSLAEKKKSKFPILVFHGFELFLVILLLSFWFHFFIFIFLGCLFHMFLDYIDIFLNKDPLYVKLSPVYVYLNNKNKK